MAAPGDATGGGQSPRAGDPNATPKSGPGQAPESPGPFLLLSEAGGPAVYRPFVPPVLPTTEAGDHLAALQRAVRWLELQRAMERSAVAAAELARSLLAVAEGGRQLQDMDAPAVVTLVVDLISHLLGAEECALGTVEGGHVRLRVARGIPVDQLAVLISRWQDVLKQAQVGSTPEGSAVSLGSPTAHSGGELIPIVQAYTPVAVVYVRRSKQALRDEERLIIGVLTQAAHMALSAVRPDGKDQDKRPTPGLTASPSGQLRKKPVAALSPREREVLALLGEGLSNREIADRLFISPKTAKAHVSNILRKLQVSDRTKAAVLGLRSTRESGTHVSRP